jgi:predicted small lipoprotein YifL
MNKVYLLSKAGDSVRFLKDDYSTTTDSASEVAGVEIVSNGEKIVEPVDSQLVVNKVTAYAPVDTETSTIVISTSEFDILPKTDTGYQITASVVEVRGNIVTQKSRVINAPKGSTAATVAAAIYAEVKGIYPENPSTGNVTTNTITYTIKADRSAFDARKLVVSISSLNADGTTGPIYLPTTTFVAPKPGIDEVASKLYNTFYAATHVRTTLEAWYDNEGDVINITGVDAIYAIEYRAGSRPDYVTAGKDKVMLHVIDTLNTSVVIPKQAAAELDALEARVAALE